MTSYCPHPAPPIDSGTTLSLHLSAPSSAKATGIRLDGSLLTTSTHFTTLTPTQVDFNVPLDSSKKVTNTQRIAGAIPTIKYALDHGAKTVILMSHLGRPDGKKNEKYSLAPVVPELEKLLGKKVTFAPDCVGEEVEKIVNGAKEGEVVLLENLRFHAEEEGSSKDSDGKKVKADKGEVEKFREQLTKLGDIFVSTYNQSLT